MPQKKIDVVFDIPDYDDFSVMVPITRISAAQLKQLQESVACAQLPADACPSSMSVKYEDHMSFLAGGARRNRIAGRRRVLTISDLFFLREFDRVTQACGRCHSKNTIAMMRHCATNLRTGKCKDEFMRKTIGAVLFPRFYAKEKQK